MKRTPIPQGSDVLLRLEFSDLGENIHLNTVTSYTLKFTAGTGTKTFTVNNPASPPSGITAAGADAILVALSTSDLDRGDLYLRATVVKPDDRFPSGHMTEIKDFDLYGTVI